jgi:hypothetical protein
MKLTIEQRRIKITARNIMTIEVERLGFSLRNHEKRCSACRYGIACSVKSRLDNEYKRQITSLKEINKDIAEQG